MPFARRFDGSGWAETTDAHGRSLSALLTNVIGVTELDDTTSRLSLILGGDMDVKATYDEVFAVIEPTPDYVEPAEPPPPGDLTGGLFRIHPQGGGLAYQMFGENRQGDWAFLQQNGNEIVVYYLTNETNPEIQTWPYLGVVNG